MLALLLVEIGLKILAAKIGGKAEELAKIPGWLRESVAALNKLAIEETGKPIDLDNITEHHHFSGSAEPETPES